MSGDEIHAMKRQRKAMVLLEMNEHEGTLTCLRYSLTALKKQLHQPEAAIDRLLNSPGLLPGLEPSMKDGILSMPMRDRHPERVNMQEAVRELEDQLNTYKVTEAALFSLREELKTL